MASWASNWGGVMSKFSEESNLSVRARPARSVLFGLVSLAGFVALAGAAQAQIGTAQSGVGSAPAPRMVNLGALPQMTAAEIAATPHVSKPFYTGVDPVTFGAMKARAGALRFAPAPGTVTGPPAIPQRNARMTPAAQAVFTSTDEVTCGNVTPADQALAVGDGGGASAAVLQAINVCVNVYTKGGSLFSGYPKSAAAFFGLSAGTPMSDPRAFFDWISHRYIVVMISFDPTFASVSNYHLAVSTGDDPNGTYCTYTIGVQSVAPSGGVFPLPDFPRIGQDRQAIYLASNIFNKSFKWEEVMALPKTKLYSCSALSFNYKFDLLIGGIASDSTQPVYVYSSGDQPRAELMVTSKNINFSGGSCSTGCNGLMVWGWYEPLPGGANVLTGVPVATTNSYSLPPGAPQKGTGTTINTGDTRISGTVVYSAGRIYPSINTNGGGGAPACIVYNISPGINYSDGSLHGETINNERILNGWYYCTQEADPEGNVTTVGNYSDSSTYASLVYVTRRVSLPSSATFGDNGLTAISGAGPYTEGRWGDYTATSIAGLVSGGGTGGFPTMWFAGMYARSDNKWQTAIGRNGYTDNSQP
jgi:hypothetical protein